MGSDQLSAVSGLLSAREECGRDPLPLTPALSPDVNRGRGHARWGRGGRDNEVICRGQSERDGFAGVGVVTPMACPGGTGEIAVTPQRSELQPLVLLIEEPWIVPRMWLDVGQILLLPPFMVSAMKRVRVVDLNAEAKRQRATLMPGELRERATTSGQDEHHSPVAVAERSLERLQIDMARTRRIAGVGVNPDPPALFRATTEVDLLLEVFSHRDVVERDECLGAALADELDLADQQQVIGAGDAKRSDLGLADITQEQQLGPGCRREPQARVRSRP